jgi:hypothetical protein
MIDSRYRFFYLPNLENYYHLGWYFKKGTSLYDDFSKCIKEEFKEGLKSGLEKMVQASRTGYMAFLKTLNIDSIVVARGSDEDTKTLSTKNWVGLYVQELIKYRYLPPKADFESLFKTKTNNKLHTAGGRNARIALIDNSYKFENTTGKETPHILLVDDISTTGTTIDEIHRAITETTPNAKLSVICMAQTINPRYEKMPAYCIDERPSYGFYLTFNNLGPIVISPEKDNRIMSYFDHIYSRMIYYKILRGNTGRCRYPSSDGNKYNWYIQLKGVKTKSEAEVLAERVFSYTNA